MPIIEGYNDSDENIEAIAEFMQRLDLFEIKSAALPAALGPTPNGRNWGKRTPTGKATAHQRKRCSICRISSWEAYRMLRWF
jgi:hypothetical protein